MLAFDLEERVKCSNTARATFGELSVRSVRLTWVRHGAAIRIFSRYPVGGQRAVRQIDVVRDK
jgi:hypothetical protein